MKSWKTPAKEGVAKNPSQRINTLTAAGTGIFAEKPISSAMMKISQSRNQKQPRKIVCSGIWLCCMEAAARATDPWHHRLYDADELGLSKFAHAVERFNGYFNLSHTTSVIA